MVLVSPSRKMSHSRLQYDFHSKTSCFVRERTNGNTLGFQVIEYQSTYFIQRVSITTSCKKPQHSVVCNMSLFNDLYCIYYVLDSNIFFL